MYAPSLRSILAPATRGDVPAALAAIDAARTPDELAMSARALWMLGRHVPAQRLATRAQREGGLEAAALALFLDPHAAPHHAARLALASTPGQRADAWCDLAALHLRAGRFGLGRRAVERASATAPDHAEAGHWRRFIADNHNEVRLLLRSGDVPRRMAPLTYDLKTLTPHRESGWLSRERLLRRIPAWAEGLAPAPDTALHRLIDAGITSLALGTAEEYATMAPSAVRVELELEADLVRALVAESRAADGATSRLLLHARRIGPRALHAAERVAEELSLAA